MNNCYVVNNIIYTENELTIEALQKFNSLVDTLENISKNLTKNPSFI